MFYPANYGFIPHTLSGDGDPCDILVVTHVPLAPSCIIASVPFGVLPMKDESGQDENSFPCRRKRSALHLAY